MTLRLIIKTEQRHFHGTEPVSTFRTVELEIPGLEQLLRAGGMNEDGTFMWTTLVGVETIDKEQPSPSEAMQEWLRRHNEEGG